MLFFIWYYLAHTHTQAPRAVVFLCMVSISYVFTSAASTPALAIWLFVFSGDHGRCAESKAHALFIVFYLGCKVTLIIFLMKFTCNPRGAIVESKAQNYCKHARRPQFLMDVSGVTGNEVGTYGFPCRPKRPACVHTFEAYSYVTRFWVWCAEVEPPTPRPSRSRSPTRMLRSPQLRLHRSVIWFDQL